MARELIIFKEKQHHIDLDWIGTCQHSEINTATTMRTKNEHMI
jgi:hypothetical protein